jgi:putative transposase
MNWSCCFWQALIDAEYTRHPFYGSRKMVVHLGKMGHLVNRKRVQRLMGILGLAGMALRPNTSIITVSPVTHQ